MPGYTAIINMWIFESDLGSHPRSTMHQSRILGQVKSLETLLEFISSSGREVITFQNCWQD